MPIELPDPQAPKRARRVGPAAIVVGAALLLWGGLQIGTHFFGPARGHDGADLPPQSDMLQCKQTPLIVPDFAAAGVSNSSIFTTPEYESYSIDMLAGAVRIPTVSYDDMSFDVVNEPRFDIFKDLHAYFAQHFPLLWQHVETVNTYGLLYTIEGTTPDLKPLLLMAHQDVVPVAEETLNEWEQDPFGGVFDGEWLHGRGTCDTKNMLVAIHEAVEALLKQGWTPERTLLLSFGFDEEIQGYRGAKPLAEFIEERYGPDSIEMIIDEGMGFQEMYGQYFAMPAVAEKGRLNFKFTLNTPGGHSSMPPDHTGIGIISDLVTRMESDVPLPASLTEYDVIKGLYSCFGQFGDDELDPQLRKMYTNLGSAAVSSELAETLGDDRLTRIMVETTQAIDIIHGGVKINALPEQTTMEVNYRIKPDSSVEEESERIFAFVKGLAADYSLGVNHTNTYFGAPAAEPDVIVPTPAEPAGFLLVETSDLLHVAPISPFYSDSHWDLVSGTTKHVLEDVAEGFDGLSVVMAPSLMGGNTDTAHYWGLTTNIYRYFPSLMSDTRNVHTVNEALRPRSHLSTVIFFYELLVNMDTEL